MKKKRQDEKKAVKRIVHKRKKVKKEIKNIKEKPIISPRPKRKREDKTMLRLLVILLACLLIYLVILMATMPPEQLETAPEKQVYPGEKEPEKEKGEPLQVEIEIT